jgi:hypothetical protein
LPSSADELRRALFEEGGHAFAIVLGESEAAHLIALEVELLIERALAG